MLWFLLGLLAVVVLVGLFFASVYSKLVRLREQVRNGFSQIDVQLERRHDLIPNLVETVKGYLKHERETLEAVVAARSAATQARIEVSGDPENLEAMAKLGQSEASLGGALGRLLAVAEAYPDLKADRSMADLTEELTTTENKIAFARQNYNDQVTKYQTYKTSVPPVVLAGAFGFDDSAYLDLDEASFKRENVQVNFDQQFPPQANGPRD